MTQLNANQYELNAPTNLTK